MVDYTDLIKELNPTNDELLEADLLSEIYNTDISNLSYEQLKEKLIKVKKIFISEEIAYNGNTEINNTDTDNIDSEYSIDAFSQYIKQIAKYPLLTPEEEKDLFIKYKNGDKELFDKLVNSNLRLVINVAKRYNAQDNEIMDLIGEGNIGLMHAIEKYDPNKGFKFSTYAFHWIRQAITISLPANSSNIVVPRYALTDANKKNRKIFERENKLGRELTEPEVKALFKTDADYDRFKSVRMARSLVGLESKVGEDGESELGDFIVDENAIKPDENAALNNRNELIRQAIDECLNDTEKDVILKWFGFGEYRDCDFTYEDIGKERNVSRQRVEQIEKKALKKLLRSNKIRKLGD